MSTIDNLFFTLFLLSPIIVMVLVGCAIDDVKTKREIKEYEDYLRSKENDY